MKPHPPHSHLMVASGGSAKRLTYLGVDTTVVGWTPSQAGAISNRIVFASNSDQAFSNLDELYTLAAMGQPSASEKEVAESQGFSEAFHPEKLPTGYARHVAFGPGSDTNHLPMIIARHTTDIFLVWFWGSRVVVVGTIAIVSSLSRGWRWIGK